MILVITGPTCLGKSETAVAIATKFNAEIINGDAFQIYQELNIGVAKPSDEDLIKVPHHLYSFVSPSKTYSIMEYQRDLRAKIAEIMAKNKNIIIVGGSGLYIKSALYDYEFKEQTPIDMSKYEKMDNLELHKCLEEIDPVDAKKIHFNNRKRMLRAIEIYLANNKSKTELNSEQNHKPIYDAKFFVKDMPRELLYENINKRVDKMMNNGLIDEVKSLSDKYGFDAQAMQAIGYKEFKDYFDNKMSLEDTVELIKKNTRNYAKRQMTFIRHQFDVIYYKDTNDLIRIIEDEKLLG